MISIVSLVKQMLILVQFFGWKWFMQKFRTASVRKRYFKSLATTFSMLRCIVFCVSIYWTVRVHWKSCTITLMRMVYRSLRLARNLLFFVVDSVCPSGCHGQTSYWFFFVSRWNRLQSSHFLAVSSPRPPLQNFFDFWFRPPNAQNLLPIVCTKLPISWLVLQIDRRSLRMLRGFWGWPFNGTMLNVLGPTFVAMATTFGLGAEI